MMPTIERMRVSPEGQSKLWMIKDFRYLVLFLHLIITVLTPFGLFWKFMELYDEKYRHKFMKTGAKSLYHTRCLNNVLYMASDELNKIDQLDFKLVRDMIGCTTYYYTPGDRWAPAYFGEEL